MGQEVKAVVLGVPLTKKLNKKLYPETDDQPVDLYDVPGVGRVETGTEGELVSLIVAGGEDGEPDLPTVFALADAETVFKKELAAIRKRWTKLAEVIREKLGEELPEPSLYLLNIEVA
jgi:hypothetical protein